MDLLLISGTQEIIDEETMKTYITFGQAHIHRVNNKIFDKDCVAVIEAESESAARKIAFEHFGPVWSFSYPEDRWGKDEMKYFPRGLIEVN